MCFKHRTILVGIEEQMNIDGLLFRKMVIYVFKYQDTNVHVFNAIEE
jgi:hypothetical protein